MSPSEIIRKKFAFAPTAGQELAFRLLDKFIEDKTSARPVFLLRGYAGTGKTTLLSALVHTLDSLGYSCILMAPTGRAAKVMSNYSGKYASTIHRQIYQQEKGDGDGLVFRRKKNILSKTFFIVDEASMISDMAESSSQRILSDVVDYVFEKKSNKLILVGDTAQLPPVKLEISPALEGGYLKSKFFANLYECELTEVVRQEMESGILRNATMLRKKLTEKASSLEFITKGYKDIYRMTGEKMEDGLRYAYKKYGEENTIVITRSNKSATGYNRYIRQTIKAVEDEVSAGDLLMVVKNNYATLPEDSPAGFLANGEFVEVMKVKKYEEIHGFRFVHLELRLLDYPKHPTFEAVAFLDILYSNNASLTTEQNKLLFESVWNDYSEVMSKRTRLEAVKKDSYFTALQVKFAYALTCHKSQGGQWDAVFVDQGYLTEENLNEDFLRWLYTAITRATKEVFLVNFNARFYGSESSESL
ncbi:MAG TPA: AAA family ATPase [Cytophagaceae bacterium]|nr:AAA family ATPase [Cytophagaceae bacterium]